ncbi:HdeD family acid-resistance protein [Stenotrophomonas sp. MYb238]|uniref:HdeD family acid-resistance protein n=1 Tax=Stenotrophomonas sp. MYb238 TaxID=2040281 RepID=UPI0012922304|nr:HdeD family acid-resistance protein [Stenotrophomonas sp. MYb238]MQP77292.1 HdeD family acid-resistance protein [Stenotrophomonas sp. MYb238]
MNGNPDFPAGPLFGTLSRHWWVVLLFGLFAVAFGVLALMAPVRTAAVLAMWLGVMAIVEGVVALASAVGGSAPVSRGWAVFYALVSIAFGVLAILNPLATASVLLLFLAAWLVVGGIYRIVFAIRVRRHIRGEWLLVLSGLLAVALGVMFALNPLGGLMVTSLWIGAMALVYGVLQVVVAFRLRRLGRTAV